MQAAFLGRPKKKETRPIRARYFASVWCFAWRVSSSPPPSFNSLLFLLPCTQTRRDLKKEPLSLQPPAGPERLPGLPLPTLDILDKFGEKKEIIGMGKMDGCSGPACFLRGHWFLSAKGFSTSVSDLHIAR
uniref:Uncharacterized protein n=1 Tax=Sphaerodactylus townsendi TaxID=933632 RepID=A0ACB8G6R2_9SAUR